MHSRRRQTGFTLIELLTVIIIIALVMAIAFPSFSALMGGGATTQARNLLDAQLSAARGIAIRNRQYTCLHVQKHHARDEYWVGVFMYDPAEQAFGLVDGMDLAALPSGVMAAEVGNGFVDGGNYNGNVATNTDAFTTFSVLFDPDGRLVSKSPRDDGKVRFVDGLLFDPGKPRQRVWDLGLADSDDEGVRAICVFDAKGFNAASNKAGYLNQSARFLPVNPYVGGLIKTPAAP